MQPKSSHQLQPECQHVGLHVHYRNYSQTEKSPKPSSPTDQHRPTMSTSRTWQRRPKKRDGKGQCTVTMVPFGGLSQDPKIWTPRAMSRGQTIGASSHYLDEDDGKRETVSNTKVSKRQTFSNKTLWKNCELSFKVVGYSERWGMVCWLRCSAAIALWWAKVKPKRLWSHKIFTWSEGTIKPRKVSSFLCASS